LTDKHEHEHYLSIHASSLEESIICLDYLVGLKDTHFQQMGLSYKDHSGTRLCRFAADILEKILQNSSRRIKFIRMIFTPDHCRILASSGTKTNIEFYECIFQDEGAAFVEASAARQDETSGPAKLCIWGDDNDIDEYFGFNDRNMTLFLNQCKLESLELRDLHFDSEDSCRAVASAEVRCLTLGGCDLEDGATALVEAVRDGYGPKELCFEDGHPFYSSSESLIAFLNALRGNTNLERLRFPIFRDTRQQTRALAAALRENKGLVHLPVFSLQFDKSGSSF
jgi:hypothetical protein